MKFAALVLLLGSAVISTSSATMLNVTVYYESLCPDSIAFITKQLAPSYEAFKPFLNLSLVPYGLAKLNESEPAKFECRHGERECDGDKVHACLLANDSITMESKLKFINCTMSIAKKNDTEYPVKQCANTLPSPAMADELINCAANNTGTTLMFENKQKTEAVKPAISKVPVIVVNEKYTDSESEQARTAFKSLLCKYVGQNEDVCSKSGAAGTAVFGLSLSLITMFVVYANI